MSDIEIDVLNNQTPEIDIDNISSSTPEIDIESSTEAIPELEGVALYGPQGPKGDKGDKGEKGEQGVQGEQGETGATGNGISSIEKTSTSGLVDTYTITYTNGDSDDIPVTNGKDGTDGQDGAAATITVGTVTTGSAGSSASITNSGTTSAAVFDFVIPRGDKGETGSTGATGQDGFSPTATVTQSGEITTISITDKNGTTTESIDLSTKQNTLIAGTDLEIIPAGLPILPEGYTQIEYIEGTGTQYIDTGFYGTQNSGAYIRFALTDLTSNGSARVFGTRNGTGGTGAFAFISSYNGTSLPSDQFYLGSQGSAAWPAYLDTDWHEFACNVQNDKAGYFDNVLVFRGTNTAFTSVAEASIFRRYNRTSYNEAGTCKISEVRIYEEAVLVHHYLPCRRDSDDELGMYDVVADTFLTNSGTGTFIAGADVVFTPQDKINFTNESGYIKGIDSTDVTTALGYTPYDSSNPAGYTSNVGTVTSVNNNLPDANGDVTLTIPTVNDGILTITQNGTSKGTFSANQSTNDTIALTDTTYNTFTGADGTNAGSSGLVPAPSATDNTKFLKGDGTWASVSGGSSTDVQINGTSITSGGVANIVTNTAYNATSNKIATMSDIPADEIFVATYGTTTFNEVWTAYDAGKTVFVKDDITTTPASAFGGILAILNYFEFNSALDAHFEFASSILNDGTYYTYTLDQDSIWDEYTEQIPDTSGFANTDLSNLSATGEAHFGANIPITYDV